MEAKQNTQKKVQRTFIIGDEWLYYKFYSGPKTADSILTEMIKPAVEKLLSGGYIDKWFFIRYSDPKLHIRVRFHLTKPDFIFNVVQTLHSLTEPYIEQDLIWKVQVDSYQREIERYGIDTMDQAEELFFHDSRMIVDMLDMIAGDEGEKYRWMFALRAVDTLLDDFHVELERKLQLLTVLKESFGREFGINKGLREQLKAKYRDDREEVRIVLDRSQDKESEMKPLFDLLERKSEVIRPIVKEFIEREEQGRLHPQLNDLLGSYIHMLLNRLFKSKQRVHELVIYDFLWNVYKSTLARQKHHKKEKKK
jgi:thiopeptide-type bacteriocin biosynthesis protein